MRRAALKGRDARDRERVRSEREMANEPGEIDEVARSSVLDVTREGQGVKLLGEVLVDRVNREL